MSSRLDRISDWEEQARLAHYRAADLAVRIQVSDRHLRRYFLGVFGVSPQEWIDQLRLRDSWELLRGGEQVKLVAFKLGYRQSAHFCRVFKLCFGITPAASANVQHEGCPREISNVRER